MKNHYVLLFLLLLSRAAFSQDQITVEANTVLKDVSQHPVGINVDYLMDDDSYLQPATSTADALKQMGVKFLRFPGGEKSDNYLWSQYPYTSANPTLALSGSCHWPNEDPRFTQSDYKSLKSTTLDFDEFMDMVHTTGAQPLIVVNGDGHRNNGGTCGGVPPRDSLVEAARQWVRYANVVHQYGIKYWMIGNESYHSAAYDGAVTATEYLSDLLVFAEAMKAEDPTIKIIVNGSGDSWWKTILSDPKAASLIDYLGVSVYPIYNWASGYDYFQTSSPNFTGDVTQASNAIDKYVANATDRQRIKVIATEYNAIDWNENGWLNRNDLGHALVDYEMFGQLLLAPRLDLAFMWNTRYVDNKEIPYNVFDALSSSGKLQATGQALSIWGNYLLRDLVAVNSTSSVISYASKDDTKLTVLLLNKDTAAQNVTLNLKDYNSDGTGQVQVFTGSTTDDTAPTLTPAAPVAASATDPAKYTLTLSPTSVTVVTFAKADPVTEPAIHLTLVDADTEQDLMELTDGDELNLLTLPTQHLNIRADADAATVKSISFLLSGAETKTATESMQPYTLFGDDTHGDYYSWAPDTGSYTLKVTPYSGSKATGTAGATATVHFKITTPVVPIGTEELITSISASSGKSYTLATLQPGVLMYTDRPYQITSVPENLAGASLIQTANNDKWDTSEALLSFDLTKDATVYVAYDPRETALPAWLADWEKGTDQIGVDDSKISYMEVYHKTFAAGPVILGGNRNSPATGAQNNYFVVAKVATVTPPATTALVTNVAPSTGNAYTLANLTAGVKMYTDRTYQVTSVPPSLEQAVLIQSANNDKWNSSATLFSFDLSQQATVLVAYDPRESALPGWLADWKKESAEIGVNDSKISSMELYSKVYPAGKVTLSGNLAIPAKGAENNYFTIVLPGAVTLEAGQAAALRVSSETPEVATPELLVYPNPTTGQEVSATLAHFGPAQNVKLTLYDSVSGRTLLSHSVTTDAAGTASLTLPLRHPLPSGVYMVQAQSASGQSHARLLVIK